MKKENLKEITVLLIKVFNEVNPGIVPDGSQWFPTAITLDRNSSNIVQRDYFMKKLIVIF